MITSVRIVISCILILSSAELSSGISKKTGTGDEAEANKLWLACKLDKLISFDIFKVAVNGYALTEKIRKKNIFTIIDFSKPSTEQRCYIIDMDKKRLLYHCFVAHGRNSGDNVAANFSNKPESLRSSLGFYLTAETYSGKHGYSLRLDGLEKNINDNARSREIVIHGADYVSQKFIDVHGRLGRSWGCPALPPEITKEVIDRISNGSCLFIYGKDESYFANSTFINIK
jgi:hypothetical protein